VSGAAPPTHAADGGRALWHHAEPSPPRLMCGRLAATTPSPQPAPPHAYRPSRAPAPSRPRASDPLAVQVRLPVADPCDLQFPECSQGWPGAEGKRRIWARGRVGRSGPISDGTFLKSVSGRPSKAECPPFAACSVGADILHGRLVTHRQLGCRIAVNHCRENV
jgi:hypothetical protein